MASSTSPSQIHPGRGLGFLVLGASLHGVLTRLKAQPQKYGSLEVIYSASHPIQQPVILNLPTNGIRLRFDGPDQRLRLIEVLDFLRAPLNYKNNELVRRSKSVGDTSAVQETQLSGPAFRHIYSRLFGPSYPGEYSPPDPNSNSDIGTYVLSYPGIAFSFPLKHDAWSAEADFVSLLSSSAASLAKSMAIYQGSSWSEARATLYTKTPLFPRSIALSGRNKEFVPDEIEKVHVHGAGRLEFVRKSSQPFWVTLSETTPQDLVAELGPPDAIYRKNDTRISIHGANAASSSARQKSASPTGGGHSTDTDASSAHSFTEESDTEVAPSKPADQPLVVSECFYNYFHHGFDALISYPITRSPPFPETKRDAYQNSSGWELSVTKILLHGNVPGSYPFNRHRRSRWTIDLGSSNPEEIKLTSETTFAEISRKLKDVWKGSYSNEEEERSMQRGMVLNRGWDESPESSVELLGGWEDSTDPQRAGASGEPERGQGLGNTELFGFPGLLFEVLKNGAVSCLTVY